MKAFKILTFIFLMLLALYNAPAIAALSYSETYISASGSNNIVIIVNSSIYDPINSALKGYIADLESEDFQVRLIKYISGNVVELKDYLKSLPALKGAILIGNLPTAWFEINNDFNQNGYKTFPVDLFLMDLNGQWIDSDSNGIYDDHIAGTGTLGPEIWVAHLLTANISHGEMDEAGLLRNYFQKNIDYRRGNLSVNHRALSYPDDDWSSFGVNYMNYLYNDVTTINDTATTCAADYKLRLKENYEFIGACIHSSETRHYFKVGGAWEVGGTVYNWEVRDIDPTALFYNLFACSNCRFTSNNYMGGHYAFAKTNGLLAIGSTKTGSMLGFYNFYQPLGSAKKNFGEAFKDWFNAQNLGSFTYRCWFYGMTLLGDPTLTIDPPIARIDSVVNNGTSVSFQGSGSAHTVSISGYQWRSDKDGVISTNASFSSSTLSAGAHMIYFKVRDNLGRWSSEASELVTFGFKYGDTSGDNEISAYDAALTAQAAVGIITLSSQQREAADVSGDEEVSAYDAALIAQKAVGIIDLFPVEI